MNQLDEAIWIHDGDGMLYGFRLRRRATVVRLAAGGLWVHSPTPLTPGLQAELAAIGEVAFLVAPNNGHDSWIAEWADAYPRAEVHVAKGVSTSRAELRVDGVLGHETAAPWSMDLDQATMVGVPSFDESVFLHRASRSLIVSDLVQNHSRSDQRGLGRLVARFVSERQGYKGLCLAHQLSRPGTIEDHGAFSMFLDRVAGWEFDRIIVAHGAVVEEHAQDVLAELIAGTSSR